MVERKNGSTRQRKRDFPSQPHEAAVEFHLSRMKPGWESEQKWRPDLLKARFDRLKKEKSNAPPAE